MDMDESVPDGEVIPEEEPDVDLDAKVYEIGKDDDEEYSDDDFYECQLTTRKWRIKDGDTKQGFMK